MELWIRSQNKERIRLVDNIRIYQEEGQIDFNIQDSGSILGTYATKERALEVLDDIKNHICDLEVIKTYASMVNLKGNEEKMKKLFQSLVYQMPEE